MTSTLIHAKCVWNIWGQLQIPRHLRVNVRQYGVDSTPHRHFSLSSSALQRISDVQKEKKMGIEVDLKPHAVDMFKFGVRSVRPRQMIESVLDYSEHTSTLRVENRTYYLNKNVYVVGFGKAVLGMARVVENILGSHIRTGIVSIPKGLPKQLADTENFNAMLSPSSKIQMYEGAGDNRVDETSFEAAKAIHNLVSNLSESDVVIVLCSGGGSVLCPYPQPPITLDELRDTIHVLSHHAGGSIKDINTVRKNIEVLKGGGLALEAKPAKMISLILSSIIGDPMDLIAGGTTHPTNPTPHQCIEIFQRLGITDKIPNTVIKYLEKEVKTLEVTGPRKKNSPVSKASFEELGSRVQNIVVGNNSIACEAAAEKALELGYLPLILTKKLTGEACRVGSLYAKLSKFIMLCFDRNASAGPNVELARLELELVSGGIKKEWMNNIIRLVDTAHNMSKDLCIISGGETFVQVDGKGVGGKNMETALAAAFQMKQEFQSAHFSSETKMCFLSADTDGYDGLTRMSGAVVDQDFVAQVEEAGLDMEGYLRNNDSFSLFSKVNGSKNLINTQLTGTNVMDIVILLVKRPID